jgi:hypothetical protein
VKKGRHRYVNETLQPSTWLTPVLRIPGDSERHTLCQSQFRTCRLAF